VLIIMTSNKLFEGRLVCVSASVSVSVSVSVCVCVCVAAAKLRSSAGQLAFGDYD